MEGGKLKIGNRTYQQVVLPPFIENVNSKTKAFLDQVATAVTGNLPDRVDGTRPSLPRQPLTALPANWTAKLNNVVSELCEDQKKGDFHIERAPGDKGILFHHRRQLADGQVLFLVNTSIEHPSSGVVVSSLRGAESWNLYTGAIKPFPVAKLDTGISVKFDLPPSGSLLLFLSQKPVQAEVPHESRRHAPRHRPAGNQAP